MEFKTLVSERMSIRHFLPDREIAPSVIKNIIQTAQKAPSWKNSQTGRYYIASSPEALKKVRALLPAFNQKSCENAPVLIVTTYVCGISGFSDGEPTNELGDAWGMYDLGLQNAYLLLAAREEGIDSLVMGIRDADGLRELLDIPDDEEVAAVIALGYRESTPKPRPRLDTDEIIHFV